MTIHPAPKPEPREKKPRKRLVAKTRLQAKTPIKKQNKERMKKAAAKQSAWYSSKEWAAMRMATFIRDGWRCVDCEWSPLTLGVVQAIESMLHGKGGGDDRWLECDHVVNTRFGGDERPEDLTTRCNLCHREKHATPAIKPRFMRAG